MSEQDSEDLYPCIGVCMADPASGLCQGCGRPLAEPETPDAASESLAPVPPAMPVTDLPPHDGGGVRADH